MKTTRVITLIMGLVFISACVSASRLEEAEKQRDAALEEAARLEQERDAIAQERDEFASELEALQSELSQLREERAEANERLVALEQENAQSSEEIEQNNQERTRLQQRIADLESRINDLDERSRKLLTALRNIQAQRTALNAELDRAVDDFVTELEDQLADGDLDIHRMDGLVRLSFRETALFESGHSQLGNRGQRVLASMADVLKRIPNVNFYVEGHTDSRRIGQNLQRRYPTNWELGAARAITVVRYLTENTGIAPERVAAVSHGPFHPVASNDDAAGRAQNRRIEVTLSTGSPRQVSAASASQSQQRSGTDMDSNPSHGQESDEQ